MGTGVSPKRIATRNSELQDWERINQNSLGMLAFLYELFDSCTRVSHATERLCLEVSQAVPFWRGTSTELLDNSTIDNNPYFFSSLERRWSSRTFRYGYLVTTSPQLSVPPSAAPSFRLGHWLRALPTPMVWRAVCTRPGNVFTATFWFAITSDSSFM